LEKSLHQTSCNVDKQFGKSRNLNPTGILCNSYAV